MTTEMESVRDGLRGFACCRHLDDSELSQVAALSHWKILPEGKTLFREGSLAKDIYLIVHGVVGLSVGYPNPDERLILEVGPGEMLGWSAIVERSPVTATVQTFAPTRAIVIHGKKLRKFCEANPIVAHHFLHAAAQTACDRLLTTHADLLEPRGLPLYESIANE